MNQLFRTKSIDALIAASEDPARRLRQDAWVSWSLVALGVGAVIEYGHFHRWSEPPAAGETLSYPFILHAPLLDILLHGPNVGSTIGRPGAGPAVALSCLLAGLACAFAALCYAEFASMIPIAGSAYTYAYATLGEIFAWIIGWDLILEYMVGPAPSPSAGRAIWSRSCTASGLESTRRPGPSATRRRPRRHRQPAGRGHRPADDLRCWSSASGNRAGSTTSWWSSSWPWSCSSSSWAPATSTPPTGRPLLPFGWSGVLTGAGLVFFAYIGFDAVSTAAEECQEPPARPAHRHHRLAGHLHRALHRRGRRS